jgi:hypothetical protein
VQDRGDFVGDDVSLEPARGLVLAAVDDPPIEYQADLVEAADSEVVAHDLLEKDPARHRPVQHLGHENSVCGSTAHIGTQRSHRLGERIRQDGQPLAQQRLDVLRAQTVTDRLQRGHVIAGGKAVAQLGEADHGLGGLALAHSLPSTHSFGVNGKYVLNDIQLTLLAGKLGQHLLGEIILALALGKLASVGDRKSGRAVAVAASPALQ